MSVRDRSSPEVDGDDVLGEVLALGEDEGNALGRVVSAWPATASAIGSSWSLADGGHRRFPSRPSFCGILVPPPPLGTHPRRDTRPAAGTARAFSTTTAIREPRWMRHYNNGYLYSAKRENTA